MFTFPAIPGSGLEAITYENHIIEWYQLDYIALNYIEWNEWEIILFMNEQAKKHNNNNTVYLLLQVKYTNLVGSTMTES